MKIGFFGTPEISAYCLEHLSLNHDIVFAMTREDKKSGRHLHLSYTPVKTFALGKGIPVFQPQSLKDPGLVQELRGYNADIFIVVAYGKIIPREIFDIPRLKTINLHPSMLPRLRGAAPVEWAIIEGAAKSGITVQLINERLDAGDIVLSREIAIADDIDAGELYDIIHPVGAAMLDEAVGILDSGKADVRVQDESQATYCVKIDRSIAKIIWEKPAYAIHNLVRGLSPKTGAWTTFRGKNLKIWKTSKTTEQIGLAPGHIMQRNKKLYAGCLEGALEIVSLQPETKKIMDAQSFINGARLVPGDRFE